MVKSEYPTKDEEKKIIGDIDRIDEPDLKPVTNPEEIKQLQQLGFYPISLNIPPQLSLQCATTPMCHGDRVSEPVSHFTSVPAY